MMLHGTAEQVLIHDVNRCVTAGNRYFSENFPFLNQVIRENFSKVCSAMSDTNLQIKRGKRRLVADVTGPTFEKYVSRKFLIFLKIFPNILI